ncbi:PREDICTED: WAP, Kazal, immunoglobulin, Kunitz and NTR domain-containing protein 2 [Myotis brandtii]|uniref:WAP, Kazal, immunoglobulin, Kunitz and NTR domain-containing protein 2 n=1 Tax=Myotis brandtii TaxID=109478 RepID=UPI00070412CE|nr:PREDICTED: WAP, Kazal, immunoglobulin, Kunitz and NTR domain-containing protein 2 [Myotis brandtii]
MPPPRGRRVLLLLLGVPPRGLALPPIRYSHAGICPNDMNPNLWVDAQSTCKRECETDQECETYEKCCPNVCGTKSCVAARYMDVKGKKGPVGMPKEATCDHFMCLQQGSECDIWDGQPVCKCRDRCEKEPSFTCASDGLTYYNRCYMDAEACSKGITLAVVTCWLQPPDSEDCGEEQTRWHFDAQANNCLTFTFGHCHRNRNHFETYEACARASFCRSDFVILGRVSELTEEPDAGRALVTVDEVLKDEKMGLKFLGREPLEVTLLHVDWTCPCPNVTVGETLLIIMGEVEGGMAMLRPDSFVGASSSRRVRKLREVLHKKTCEVQPPATT